MRKKYSGFTLIELMITVAILGILASIAIPSYQRYVTRSWETKAKAALEENALFLERMNARFYGYTQTRDRSQRATEKISTTNLPVKTLCSGGGCGRNYQLSVNVSDDLSKYILIARPQDVQAKSSECGALIVDSSGRQLAKYNANGNYPIPSIDNNTYNNPTDLFGGVDKTSSCF